jgi:quercetin dioxygenase-like cupin family protein
VTEQLTEIGGRLSALREIMEYDSQTMADKLAVSVDEYLKYERGEMDFSFSFLYNAANILGVDVQDLISGESPKLSKYALVRAGEGYDITRRKAYEYKHLAYTFRNKKGEPFLVTVEPKQNGDMPTLHSHDGQEFDYMLSGSMLFYLDDTVMTLNPGDSIYYDSSVPHAMKTEDTAATFLAVVIR